MSTYDLPHFCDDLRAILTADGVAGLPRVAEKLRELLGNPAFVTATFSEEMPPGKRVLFHDAQTDAYVLAHVQAPKKTGAMKAKRATTDPTSFTRRRNRRRRGSFA